MIFNPIKLRYYKLPDNIVANALKINGENF